jgi:hypothetical protein
VLKGRSVMEPHRAITAPQCFWLVVKPTHSAEVWRATMSGRTLDLCCNLAVVQKGNQGCSSEDVSEQRLIAASSAAASNPPWGAG